VDSQKLSPFSCPCDVDFIQILVRVVWSESIETTFIIPCCTKELKKKGVLRKEVVKLQKGSINKIPYLKSFFEILIYEKFQNLMCDVSNCKSGCKVLFFWWRLICSSFSAKMHQMLRVLSLFGTWKSVGKGRVICIALDQQFSKIKGFGFHP